jgi:hypothetical protein
VGAPGFHRIFSSRPLFVCREKVLKAAFSAKKSNFQHKVLPHRVRYTNMVFVILKVGVSKLADRFEEQIE